MRKRLALLVAASGAFLLLTLAFQQAFTGYGFGGADLVPLWLGGRALLFERLSPYSAQVTLRAQEAILGQVAPGGTDQFAFAYPLVALLPVLPLVFLPFSLAQAAWMAAGFFVIIATALRQAQGWPPTVIGGWLLRAARAEPGTQSLSNAFAACSFEGVEGSRPAWAIAVIVSALAFYPSVRDLALAQFALLPFACIGGTLWALEARHDRLAGVTLALACAKPQMVFLIAPFTLLWAWRKRRAFVVGFLTGGAILLFVSLALWPAWVGEWLARLDEYRRYVTQLAPLSLLPEPLVWLAALTAVGGTAWLIRQTLRGARDLASAVNWLIPLTLLIAPSTSVSDQVLLLIPLMGFAASLRNGRRALFLLGVAVLPWGWFWLTQSNGHEGAAMIWPLPVATLGILICQEAFSRKPS